MKYIPKIQIEIRYLHILDFKNIYKKIINPFFKLPNLKFTIENSDLLSEFIHLRFDQEGYAIDLRMDRLIFISEGIIDNIKNSNGILKIFFEIYDKIKSNESFIESTGALLSVWNMITSEVESFEETKNNFVKKYINTSSLNSQFGKISDVAIVIESEQDKILNRLTFGTFKNEDIAKYHLLPIKKEENINLFKQQGILFESLHHIKTKTVEFETFQKLYKEYEANSKIFQ